MAETYIKNLGKVCVTPEGVWNRNAQYNRLCLVSLTGDDGLVYSYISRKEVPAGIEIGNTDYWQLVANSFSVENWGVGEDGYIYIGGVKTNYKIGLNDALADEVVDLLSDRLADLVAGKIDQVIGSKLQQILTEGLKVTQSGKLEIEPVGNIEVECNCDNNSQSNSEENNDDNKIWLSIEGAEDSYRRTLSGTVTRTDIETNETVVFPIKHTNTNIAYRCKNTETDEQVGIVLRYGGYTSNYPTINVGNQEFSDFDGNTFEINPSLNNIEVRFSDEIIDNGGTLEFYVVDIYNKKSVKVTLIVPDPNVPISNSDNTDNNDNTDDNNDDNQTKTITINSLDPEIDRAIIEYATIDLNSLQESLSGGWSWLNPINPRDIFGDYKRINIGESFTAKVGDLYKVRVRVPYSSTEENYKENVVQGTVRDDLSLDLTCGMEYELVQITANGTPDQEIKIEYDGTDAGYFDTTPKVWGIDKGNAVRIIAYKPGYTSKVIVDSKDLQNSVTTNVSLEKLQNDDLFVNVLEYTTKNGSKASFYKNISKNGNNINLHLNTIESTSARAVLLIDSLSVISFNLPSHITTVLERGSGLNRVYYIQVDLTNITGTNAGSFTVSNGSKTYTINLTVDEL